MEKPEFIIIETHEEYHSRRNEFLGSHALADFRKCPELFRKKETGEIADEDSPSYALGRAAHVLILEGRGAFDDQFFVGEPINGKTGKPYGRNTQAYQEWISAQARETIAPSDFDFIKRLQISVWLHSEAANLLQDGIAEGVVRTNYCGIPCQIRMDFFSHLHGITDLKTCDDLTWFEADARRYGYIWQAAFYRSILRKASAETYPVHMIAVEKKQPFRCGVWRVAESALDFAETENAAAIERIKR
jgi:hypothetical protein